MTDDGNQFLDIDEYQRIARETKLDNESGDCMDEVFPLLGLAGEIGTLLSEYKKLLRDGASHKEYRERVKEDLGDILWYVSSCADFHGFSMSDIAKENMEKNRKLWLPPRHEKREESAMYDGLLHRSQQIPRHLEMSFNATRPKNESDVVRCCMMENGVVIGDPISDNAHQSDGYRFHDVFIWDLLRCWGGLQ